MKLYRKIMSLKLFFFILLLYIYYNCVFAFSIEKKNNSIFIHNKNTKKQLMFLNKNECFSLKLNNNFSLNKNKITIFNKKFIGFFQSNRFKMFYIVKSHDTLYSIAKNLGHNYHELSKFNLIKKPYKIVVGQKIWIGDFFPNQNNCSIINSEKNNNTCEIILNNTFKIKKFLQYSINKNTKKICFFSNMQCKIKNSILRKKIFNSQDWSWPIQSKKIKYIYHSKSKNKEIELFGFKGQPIFAAASGRVVFITDIFKKYGRLIILKHNANYLSIYAFNSSILVKKKDKVNINQQISTMGTSENNSVKLYFEIRYKGESVNPLNILPKIDRKKVTY